MTLDKEDRDAIEAYRATRGEGPFIAADSLVVSSDSRILLIRRANPPGRGRLAFPGGFVEPRETFLQAAIREVGEETGIALKAAPDDRRVCDAPGRDPRARIVSVAFLFRLARPADALAVRPADDAADARWFGLDDALSPEDFFADHYAILQAFGLLPELPTGG